MGVRLTVENAYRGGCLCGDVHTESHSAGGDTVQAQGWSFVEREQAFAELEAAKKPGERATFELAVSRLSRARRSLPTRTTRSLQLSRWTLNEFRGKHMA